MKQKTSKLVLLSILFAFLVGISGCGSSSSGTSSSPLPEPDVDCGGSSCID